MTTATRHIHGDPLAALREELMQANVRGVDRGGRARRALIVAAVAGALLAATAATAALTDFTTGVAEVDELIGNSAPRTLPSGERFGDRRPGAGPASEALLVPMGDGVYKTVAYLSRDGSICIAYAERHRNGVRGGGGGCPPVEWVNRSVERRGAVWQGSSLGLDKRTNQYLVDGDVKTIHALGEGDWKVLVTPPWTPEAPGARPLRLAVVIDDADLPGGEDGVQMGEIPPEAYNEPTLELTYSDGHTRVYRGRQAK
jgi:hypothetical protein